MGQAGFVRTNDLDVIEVAGALRVSVGMVVRRLKQADLGSDLTLPETSALSRLDRGGPATSSDLARLEKISPQSMGVTVAALLERGLVARERDPEDGRRILLSITVAGRDFLLARRGETRTTSGWRSPTRRPRWSWHRTTGRS